MSSLEIIVITITSPIIITINTQPAKVSLQLLILNGYKQQDKYK